MRLLVDTHVAIWWLAGDRHLSIGARRAIEQASQAFLSAVSVWEVVTKQRTGRLELPLGYLDALAEDFLELPLRHEHALEGRSLPPIHGDPFDRMLVAQALAEGLTIVTADRSIAQYDVPVLAA